MTSRLIADGADTLLEPATFLARHVYGVRRAEAEPLAGLTGIDAGPIRTIAHHDVAAVVSDVAADRSRWGGSDLLAYNDVLDALAAHGPVVPVRFGSVIADDKGVVDDLLAPEEPRLLALLDRLAGRAQFRLGAYYHDDVALAELVATNREVAQLRELTRELPENVAYAERVRLGRLVAHGIDAMRARDTEALLSNVLPLVDAHDVRLGSGADHIADITVLVRDEQRAALEEHLESVADALRTRIRLQWRGPMAPYDFVGAD